MNHVLARLDALAVVLVTPSGARTILEMIRRDASHQPSPNGGVVEPAFAASLGVHRHRRRRSPPSHRDSDDCGSSVHLGRSFRN